MRSGKARSLAWGAVAMLAALPGGVTVADTDPFGGTRDMTLYGDDNINDGVQLHELPVTVTVLTVDQYHYSLDLVGSEGPIGLPMIRSGQLLSQETVPLQFDTWQALDSYMVSDGTNGGFVYVGQENDDPADIAVHVSAWTDATEPVTPAELEGVWQLQMESHPNLRNLPEEPFGSWTLLIRVAQTGPGQVMLEYLGTSHDPQLMNVTGNTLMPVDPIPSLHYFSLFTDGEGMSWARIQSETYDPTDVGASIGLGYLVLFGDVNLDGAVNALDISGFVQRLTSGEYQIEADCNEDLAVNALDISPFVRYLVGGGSGQVVPEAGTAGSLILVAIFASSRHRKGEQ